VLKTNKICQTLLKSTIIVIQKDRESVTILSCQYQDNKKNSNYFRERIFDPITAFSVNAKRNKLHINTKQMLMLYFMSDSVIEYMTQQWASTNLRPNMYS